MYQVLLISGENWRNAERIGPDDRCFDASPIDEQYHAAFSILQFIDMNEFEDRKLI